MIIGATFQDEFGGKGDQARLLGLGLAITKDYEVDSWLFGVLLDFFFFFRWLGMDSYWHDG